MLTERGVKILKILVHSDEPIAISALADRFELSERSIRYDIEKINKVLKLKKLPLIKKVSVGSLALSNQSKILDYIDSLENLYFSSESRQKFMLYKVAITGSINLSTMSKTLSISRTSVKKDVEAIKETIRTFDLRLEQSHSKGLVLKGQENDIRNMQLAILNSPLKTTKLNELLIQPIINNFLKAINTETISQFINAIENDTNNIISDQAYKILKNYLMITINRILKNKRLETHKEDEHIYLFTPEFDKIQTHIHYLEDAFNITFNEHELIKITDLFISSPSYNFPEGFYNYWYEIETFVNRLVKEFSRSYDLDLTDDKELMKDLITYLKPILYSEQKRIENDQQSNSHFIEIYSDIYELIDTLLKERHTEHLFYLNEDDLLAMTIYFIAAVERNKYKIKTKKNILIVCGMGYGTSKLIELQLKQKYNVTIVDTIPYHYVKSFNKLEIVDLIVTTCQEAFNNINQPIIKVRPHLTKENFDALETYNLQKLERQIPLSKLLEVLNIDYKENEKSKLLELFKNSMGDLIIDDLTKPKHSLLDFLTLDNVYVNLPFENWKDAIGYSAELLHNKGYVTKGYAASLINAFEKYNAYMLIAKDVAIPHARNNNNILKTGMVLITLEKPVVTPSGKNLEVILSFTSADNVEHLDALSDFSDLLLYSNFRTFASEAKSPEAILNYIKANINHI
jgi:transcriptional antiterminator/mannitol/fructose-specific phosphotransferase system IIA component (Ntr-type)